MKSIKIIVMFIIFFFSSSCSHNKENLYPIALMISKDEISYNIHMLVINNSILSKNETSNDSKTSLYQTHVFKGKTIQQAHQKIINSTSKRLCLTKIKSIILHESIFENNSAYEEISLYLMNNPSYSSNIYLYYSNEDANKLLNINSLNSINETINYLIFPESIYQNNSIRPISVINAMKSYIDNKRMFSLPNLVINSSYFSQEDSNTLKEANIYSLDGALFLNLDGHFRYVNNNNLEGLNWKKTNENFEIELLNNDKPLNLIIKKSRWKTYIDDGEIYLDIDINAVIDYNYTNLETSEIEDLLHETVHTQITNTYFQNYKYLDIYHFHDLSYRTKKDIINYDTFNLNININIENSIYPN